jgi:hypothetical protein
MQRRKEEDLKLIAQLSQLHVLRLLEKLSLL